MKLLMFKDHGGRRLGVVRPGHDDEVIELSEPGGMLELIDAGDAGLARVRAAMSGGKGKTHKLADLELLAPLDNPRGNVIAMGRNYQKHAEETAAMEGKAPSRPRSSPKRSRLSRSHSPTSRSIPPSATRSTGKSSLRS